ncbi:NUDIX hydrolase [Thiopseudomonas denitrificans]|uniref:Phosphatase NudJ n=1 Tax=Thiopseudomonas denitrificans TaxID=1501432 RepID=A0A4V3D5I4_9GAMM|nr:NUDIX hydrolase [Thiopseudomonas denitrificans]TDQ40177.1 NUDIX domain-containing protein [Thiopseudomonas denitrificans]
MTFSPHITVASIVEQDGRFLFVREHTSRGIMINQPAGHLEAGETLEQAAVRETLEETGWHVRITAVTGIYLYLAPNGVTYQRLCFAATPLQRQDDAVLDAEIIEPLWLSPAELQAERQQWRSPLVMQCLRDHLAGSCYPLAMLKGIF